jgi:hypothetical protein
VRVVIPGTMKGTPRMLLKFSFLVLGSDSMDIFI